MPDDTVQLQNVFVVECLPNAALAHESLRASQFFVSFANRYLHASRLVWSRIQDTLVLELGWSPSFGPGGSCRSRLKLPPSDLLATRAQHHQSE